MDETYRDGYKPFYCNGLLALKVLFCCFDTQDRVRQFVVKIDVILWSGI